MKCFITGMVGAALLLLGLLLIDSQYSNYQAKAETYKWLITVQALQAMIEQKALKQNSLQGSGSDVNKGLINMGSIAVLEVDESGTIVVGGGEDGRVLVLIPLISGGRIAWRCIGGPINAIPSKCIVKG